MPCKFNKGVQVVMYVNSRYESLPMLKAIGARYLSRHNTLWRYEEFHLSIGDDKTEMFPRICGTEEEYFQTRFDYAVTCRNIMSLYLLHGFRLLPDKQKEEFYCAITGEEKWPINKPIVQMNVMGVADYMDFWELYNNCLWLNRMVDRWTHDHWDILFSKDVVPAVFNVDTFRNEVAKQAVSYEIGHALQEGYDLRNIPIIRFFERFKREFPGVVNGIPYACRQGIKDFQPDYSIERVKE